MKQNILVIGGTGKTGRKVVQLLTSKGHHVRIGSRSAEPSFDWRQPDGWASALEGMEKVYITYQPDLAVPGALEAIEQLVKVAKRQGVQKLVLLSGKGEREAELCEQVVIHSGLEYTIVRASWFSQNFSEGFFLDPILAGQVAIPKDNVMIPFVDTGDIAEVAAEVLVNDSYNGEIVELTGPTTYTFKQAIALIAKASGRDIQFHSITIEKYESMLRQHQVPEEYIWLISYLFKEVISQPWVSDKTSDIEKVLGRPARDFSDYVKETAWEGVWNVSVEA